MACPRDYRSLSCMGYKLIVGIGGRIVEMDAFLAFLDHVHGMLTATYHNTPIVLMASPQWTRTDCEVMARYVFEKTKTPALCMIHSGIATHYGLKSPNMTVIDIGYEKVDITAIHDGRVVNHMDLGSPNPDRQLSGGEIFTQNLLKILKGKGFDYGMAEQLKKSAVCEVLPYAPNEDALVELPKETGSEGAPLSTLSTEQSFDGPRSGDFLKPADANRQNGSRMETGENGEDLDGIAPEDDGVLDVATIVTSGQTKEFLAKKEKEKERGKKGAKPKDGDAGAPKVARLPNSKRKHNTFWYEEIIQEDVPVEPKAPPQVVIDVVPTVSALENGSADAGGETKPAETAQEEPIRTVEPATNALMESPAAVPEIEPTPLAPQADTTVLEVDQPQNPPDTPEKRPKKVRRDIEVGLERFTFAQRNEIDRIVDSIYRTIQGIDDMYMRPSCWDNLVFVGNGARLRGLKDNILQTLNSRHLISPSTATMFTSELPSNVATPTGTGAQTPTGSFTGAPHQLSSSGVNPLLQAATTASSLGLAQQVVATPPATSEAAGPVSAHHHFHSQTPTSIKTITLPTYLGEWTKNGFEEAMFLGAQVAARIAFCVHSNMDAQAVEAQRLMSLSRVDYK